MSTSWISTTRRARSARRSILRCAAAPLRKRSEQPLTWHGKRDCRALTSAGWLLGMDGTDAFYITPQFAAALPGVSAQSQRRGGLCILVHILFSYGHCAALFFFLPGTSRCWCTYTRLHAGQATSRQAPLTLAGG